MHRTRHTKQLTIARRVIVSSKVFAKAGRWVFVGASGNGVLFTDDDYRDTGRPTVVARNGYMIVGGITRVVEKIMTFADDNKRLVPTFVLVSEFIRNSHDAVNSQP